MIAANGRPLQGQGGAQDAECARSLLFAGRSALEFPQTWHESRTVHLLKAMQLLAAELPGKFGLEPFLRKKSRRDSFPSTGWKSRAGVNCLDRLKDARNGA